MPGVGAATGLRWHGQLHTDSPAAIPPTRSSSHIEGASEDEAEDLPPAVLWRHRMWGWFKDAPSWLISTVIHLVLLIILALITLPDPRGLGQIFFEIGDSDTEDAVDLAEFDFGTIDEPVEAPELTTEVVEVIEMPNLTDSLELFEVETPEMDLGSETVSQTVQQSMFAGRTGAMKELLLAAYGGNQQTQEAVELGLQWLRRQQQKDGSWSLRGPYSDGSTQFNSDIGATAMAILAFAGDGNTHLDGPYSEETKAGVKWLVRQMRNGRFVSSFRSHDKAYAQAQATIAICELYAMTGDSWLRPFCVQAIDHAIAAQNREGGWRYSPKTDADLSVTGWYLMALQSARSTDIEVPNEPLDRVGYYLDSVQDAEGAAYKYQTYRPASATMTAEGLLCRLYLGWDRTYPAVQNGVAMLLDQRPFDIDDHNVYYWYYATQVLHHVGDSDWRMWNDVMREQLPRAQVKGGLERGSWAPQPDEYGMHGGRLYTTCLAIYCLEVYYRHMPLYGGDGVVRPTK